MSIEMANKLKEEANDAIGRVGSAVGGFVFLISNEDPNAMGILSHFGPHPEYTEGMLIDVAAKAFAIYRSRTGSTPEQAWEVLKGRLMHSIVRNKY